MTEHTLEEKNRPAAPVENVEHDAAHEDELVFTDDVIIGRAFRWSLVVIAVAALVVVVAVVAFRRAEPPPPPTEADLVAPRVVETEATPPGVRFTDVTLDAGIDFVHTNGATGEKLLPETMGAGAAFFDYDDDGDQDLLFVNGTHWPETAPNAPSPTMALYRNDGTGRFVNVTPGSGLDVSFYGTGVAVGDYDNDGRVDVFLAAVGSNRLFHNETGSDGAGPRFTDVTAAAGVAGDPREWSTSSAFVDYDKDGDLDLFVCNYIRWSREIDFQVDYRLVGVGRAYGPPMNFEGTFCYLYRNNADGTFTDVSAEAGIRVTNPATGGPVAKALGVSPADIDRDGWIDLLVANDTVANFFFHNRGDGTFEEEGAQLGVAYDREGNATGAMGIDAGYHRNDDALGFFIGNFANEMTSAYVTQGTATLFADESITEGIGAPSRLMLTFGLFLFDYDLDGRLDLLQANGHLEEEINQVQPSQHYEQAAQLFWNCGPGHRRCFVPVPPEGTGGLATPVVGRGAAYADIDADGDLDVVLTQAGRRPLLLRNDQNLGHHWLRLKLVGQTCNRDAFGAWVLCESDGTRRRAQVMPTRSYLSQCEMPVTFGLGDRDGTADVTITWPDGSVETVTGLRTDALHLIVQGQPAGRS